MTATPTPVVVADPLATLLPPLLSTVLVDSGGVLGNIDINATPNPVCTGTLTSPINGTVGSVTFELLPPASPTATYGDVIGTLNYPALGITSTFYASRWFNTDGTQGAVGQTGRLLAYPVYQPFPPIDSGDNIMRIIFEWKVPNGGLGGGPWVHILVI